MSVIDCRPNSNGCCTTVAAISPDFTPASVSSSSSKQTIFTLPFLFASFTALKIAGPL